MTQWLEAAAQELIALANSDPPGSGKTAGHLYQLASRLDATRVAALTRLRTRVADVRYWEKDQYAVYVRIDGQNAFTVLHIGKVTGAQRVRSQTVAIRRA